GDDEGEEPAAGGETGQTQTGGQAGTGNAIKVAVLSDCQGAFGPFWEQTIGGVHTAFVKYAGAQVKNANKPSAGITGATIAGRPVNIVGYGCSNDRADKAIQETRRLMEQLDADVMIGPLSGDESIAVANYAKAHPDKTFVNGSAGAQDTTLKVRAPNFFRFNGDGAQWNAGTGDIAYNKLGWRNAAVIADDYSFAWTSAAGFIAEFCAVGGKVTKRVFPPLNTTDYSSFVRQLPTDVDGYFWAVGGTGTIPSLKAYEQAHGQIDGRKFIGNLFWGTPGQFEQLGNRVANAYVGGAGSAGDLKTSAAQQYSQLIGRTYQKFPPFPGTAASQAASTFVYNYYINTWALLKALEAVDGDISGGQDALQEALGDTELDAPYGKVRLDENRQAIQDQFTQQLFLDGGKLSIRTVLKTPEVDQSFGGTFTDNTPAPGRNFPACKKKSLPWAGKENAVTNGQPKEGSVNWKQLP
ncbi:MAG: ABC transporter substrate-binding protein, partial [Actinomycetota bacterium]|nr:ABC transporter substrate-binding protein [Actinomycetota bacterium]